MVFLLTGIFGKFLGFRRFYESRYCLQGGFEATCLGSNDDLATGQYDLQSNCQEFGFAGENAVKVNNLVIKSALVALFLFLLFGCGGSDEPLQEEDEIKTTLPVVCPLQTECKR